VLWVSKILDEIFLHMEERLNRLSNAAAVFAFVMGPPTEPVNDESKALISQLRRLGVLFSCFDMSNAPEVAAALPDHFGGDSSVSAAMLCINGKVSGVCFRFFFFFSFLCFLGLLGLAR
jgi:hypothetical protein